MFRCSAFWIVLMFHSVHTKRFPLLKPFAELLRIFPHINIRLIVGFSTGHTGTTTLSNRTSYDLKDELVWFFFEQAGVNKTFYANNFTIYDEIKHVEKIYGPRLVKIAKENVIERNQSPPGPDGVYNVTIVDLSHSSLFFYRGLIAVAKNNKDRFSLQFVRLRRDRVETAISMTGDRVPFFDYDFFRYHPMENSPNVLLKVDKSIWERMSEVERVFWVIDETEARWQRLLQIFPALEYKEFVWGSCWPGSFNETIEAVAKLVGVSLAPQGPVVMKSHAHKVHQKTVEARLRVGLLDYEYKRKMGYAYIPG